MASEGNSHGDGDIPNQGTGGTHASSSKHRGPGKRDNILMAHVQQRSRDEAPDVRLDVHHHPIGDVRSKLISYLGMLVRDCSKVPINITNWKTIPLETRKRLYEVIRAKIKEFVAKNAEQGIQVQSMGEHDAMVEVLGKEYPSRVRCLGFGPNLKHAFGISRPEGSTSSTIATSQNVVNIEIVQELQSRMGVM
uniref:Uncharacterized protein n=1 Tax=Nelumbo nucifera TaxID=4432 RepID=A0A822ZLQ9_NELNU|nr:TPA_asm: hypothetical protein HUJ06_003923 [Nelumbo nucifera]